MSVKVMSQVWSGSQHGGSALLMLLAIADFSDDDGKAYPAVATLARKCRVKPRNANYLLRQLQDSEELIVRIGDGPKGTNLYKIDVKGLQAIAGVQYGAGLQGIAGGAAKDCSKPLQPIADKPSLTIKNHQKRESRDLGRDLLAEISEELFTDFAKLRKTQKAPITKTVVNGLRREAEKAGLTLEQVITMCCERGWRSFKADWLKTGPVAAGDKPGSKPWDGAR